MKNKPNYKLPFLLVGIAIGIIIILVASINFNAIHYRLQFKIHGYTQETALAVCSGKSLERTALCLNTFVKGIYKYESTKGGENLDFEKILEVGHDCEGWTYIYQTLFFGLGFKSQKIKIPVRREENIQYAHVFLVAYDETGWCSLDQRHMYCFMYKK